MKYSNIVPILTAQAFTNINTLIFDGNNLSTNQNVDLIVSIIELFTNVSKLSFNKCQLNETSGEHLKEELLNLTQIFTDIELANISRPIQMLFMQVIDKNMEK
jgi:hypothetical protein